MKDQRVNRLTPDRDGATALWIMAAEGHTELFQKVLMPYRGLPYQIRTNEGIPFWTNKTPAEQARQVFSSELANLLDECQARDSFETLFTMIVLVSDGYLVAPKEGSKRFFKIAERLPMELQARLSRIVYGHFKTAKGNVHPASHAVTFWAKQLLTTENR